MYSSVICISCSVSISPLFLTYQTGVSCFLFLFHRKKNLLQYSVHIFQQQGVQLDTHSTEPLTVVVIAASSLRGRNPCFVVCRPNTESLRVKSEKLFVCLLGTPLAWCAKEQTMKATMPLMLFRNR